MTSNHSASRRPYWPSVQSLLKHLAIIQLISPQIVDAHKDWTNSAYPDLRGPTQYLCTSRMPEDSLLYICDPDRIFNATQLIRINSELKRLAIGTRCPCQRRSQCSSGFDNINPFHGFIVSIALVDNLQMNFHSPSEQQLIDKAESFCQTLQGRWALGDCGNSVIVFVWRHYKKIIIRPARLAERYITGDERKEILARVNDLIQTDRWAEALSQVIYELHKELNGEPEDRVDTGTLSLITAVLTASLLTILITCCVCAFRCCGNLKPVEEKDRKTFDRLKRLMSDNILLDDHRDTANNLQRSLSRPSKFPMRSTTPQPALSSLSFIPYPDTSIV